MRRFAVILLVLFFPLSGFAQDDGYFGNATEAVVSLYADMAYLVQVILGLIAMILLFVIIADIIKGDRESLSKLCLWFLGLVIGLIIIEVLKNFYLS